MPVYLYRREDGTTFDFKQKFSDEPLAIDPETGQKVVRLVQSTGVIFKGSGFYVNDSKSASKTSLNVNGHKTEAKSSSENGGDGAKSDSQPKAEGKSETQSKSDSKSESSSEKPQAEKPQPKAAVTSSAAD